MVKEETFSGEECFWCCLCLEAPHITDQALNFTAVLSHLKCLGYDLLSEAPSKKLGLLRAGPASFGGTELFFYWSCLVSVCVSPAIHSVCPWQLLSTGQGWTRACQTQGCLCRHGTSYAPALWWDKCCNPLGPLHAGSAGRQAGRRTCLGKIRGRGVLGSKDAYGKFVVGLILAQAKSCKGDMSLYQFG